MNKPANRCGCIYTRHFCKREELAEVAKVCLPYSKMDNEKLTHKKQKGITLIALVITIVVLLILAGVSLNLILNNNGVISKAKQATEESDAAGAKDEMSLYLANLKIDKAQDSNFRLADYLSTNIGNEGLEDYLNNGDGHAQVAYRGHIFLVDLNDYSFEYLGKSDGTGAIRHIRQVLNNNNEDVPGIAMVEAGELETEDLGWEVLSVNNDGTVNLIAKNNTSFEVSLSGINGYTNGVKALNEICSKLYGNLEIDGKKVLSARSANLSDFYDVTYQLNIKYEQGKKIQPYINTLDVQNDGYSTEQITDYIDASNTSKEQASNTNMLLASTSPTLRKIKSTKNKASANMTGTGNNYWLASRQTWYGYDSKGGKVQYSESIAYDCYAMNYVRTDGVYSNFSLFQVNGFNTYGSNNTTNCALRPVITVSADSVSNKTIGATVITDPFYKGKKGTDAHGYVKADSIASLLEIDIKAINKINSGLPTKETDMTWTKLEDGGYDSLTGEFDTSKYDYYIADRATNLQVRLTGAAAYNNGVLAMDTICKNLYGNLTEIKLKNGKTQKVKVVLARNAKYEDFMDDSKISDGSYGGVWSTNANDSTAPNKITSTNNRYAPTLFTQYENTDVSNGASKGYSDAKISSYILSNVGTSSFVADDQKNLYAYEKYNADPGLKVIYNAYWGRANRNIARINAGKEYWLSSRCVYAYWNNSNFRFCCVSGSSISTGFLFNSNTHVESPCHCLRPVLQVSK